MRPNGPSFRTHINRALAALAAASALVPATSAAQGDLLIAPTRLVLDGRRGGEVILSNMGTEEANYRITLELRRMDESGNLVAVDEESANAAEKAALEMIRYAPRRVSLPPAQPQSVRISARPPADLPDGEYRVHMSFAALPKVDRIAAEPEIEGGVAIALTPIYGIVMPIIVRKGNVEVTGALANARVRHGEDGPAFEIDMVRQGNSSLYGDLMVIPKGAGEPAFLARGIGVYPEIGARRSVFPISPEQSAALKGPVRIEYREASENGGGLIAALDAVL